MCDNICRSEKKYALGPAPYFPPPVIKSYPYHPIEVDTPIYEPIVKPVIKNIVQETTINVPKIEYRENIVEVPKVEYRPCPVIKEVETPVYQDMYKYKDVVVPQKQYRIKPIYKEVTVPEIEYVDKYVTKKYKRFKYVPKEVQIPFRPKKEIYEEVPIPRYIPQHLESVIQPDQLIDQPPSPLPYPPNHHIPIYENHTPNLSNMMMSPIKPLKQSNPNKCCLSSFFSRKKNNYEVGVPIPPPHFFDAESQMYNIQSNCENGTFYSTSPDLPQFSQLPLAYNAIGYSHPFVVEEEEGKDLCHCLIETTSNVLAASGVALILAGKLTYDGINYLLKISGKDKLKEKKCINDDSNNEETNESRQTESAHETLKSGRSYSYRSSEMTIDDAI